MALGFFEFRKDSGITFINFKNCAEFARVVASMNDVELFNDIYDSYNMFLAQGHYVNDDCLFCQSEYIEIMLDNDDLFQSLFGTKTYEFTELGSRIKREKEVESITYSGINPLINNCLRYALKHLDKYRQRALEMLKFGIKHNTRIMANGNIDTYRICNELGGLIELGRNNYFDCDVVDMAIFVDCEVEDKEINSLIKQLPKFKTMW